MAQNWPDDIVAQSCEFYIQHNTTVFESGITRVRQRLRRAGERWICGATFKLERAEAQRIDALLALLRGAYDTVRIWDWARRNPLGSNRERNELGTSFFSDATSPASTTSFTDAGSPSVTLFGTAGDVPIVVSGLGEGSESVGSDGWYPSLTGVLKAGDYIEFGSALYMLTEDVASDAIGQATLAIAPRLRGDVAYGSVITRVKATGEFTLADDDQPNRQVDADGAYSYTLGFVEAL